VAVRAKELRYAIDVGEGATLREENGVALDSAPEWSPEHLLLAALVRCSLKSLRHHAARARLQVAAHAGSARCLVTRRDEDDRYAIVQADVELHVDVAPQPGVEELAELLAKAERDCFVGASLRAKPSYRWTVNGRDAAASS
jgi:organic hydroperoxide reductase OsmC/OhrA